MERRYPAHPQVGCIAVSNASREFGVGVHLGKLSCMTSITLGPKGASWRQGRGQAMQRPRRGWLQQRRWRFRTVRERVFRNEGV